MEAVTSNFETKEEKLKKFSAVAAVGVAVLAFLIFWGGSISCATAYSKTISILRATQLSSRTRIRWKFTPGKTPREPFIPPTTRM